QPNSLTSRTCTSERWTDPYWPNGGISFSFFTLCAAEFNLFFLFKLPRTSGQHRFFGPHPGSDKGGGAWGVGQQPTSYSAKTEGSAGDFDGLASAFRRRSWWFSESR